MRILPLLLAICLGTLPAYGLFAPPRSAPVDRLLNSAEADVKARPQAAEAHYTLARIHYLAFSEKRDRVAVGYFEEGQPVQMLSPALNKMMGRYTQPNTPKPNELDAAQLAAHAAEAKASFEKALALDPKNAIYHLGYASLLDEVRTWLTSAKPENVAVALAKLTTADVRKAYGEAFAKAIEKDLTIQQQPLLGLDEITSYEAVNALVRLAEAEPSSVTAAERETLEKANAALAALKKLPSGPVTPIVLTMRPSPHLEQLLAPEVAVDFNLRGYGPAARWPWVKPELGFLVWDPLAVGQVESARDLFGSYSFQIFRQTGYDALAALDDNRDGRLTGDELEGIRVWFDQNSDGVSTASEVVSLESLGITGIAVRETARDGIYPMNPAGLTLRDGGTLPTWDWVAAPRGSAAGGAIIK